MFFLMERIERIITAGMITALVAVFFYQVAYCAGEEPCDR
jgi:hypothetical protein